MTRSAATRRRLLGVLGGLPVGLAGCLDSGDPDVGDDEGPADGSQDGDQVDDGESGDADGQDDDGGEDDSDEQSSDVGTTGTWPSAHYGPTNAGALLGASVPDELTERWRHGVDAGVVGSPVILDDLLVVATGHSEGVVLGLDRETGEEVWSAWTSSSLYCEPIVTDGTVYVGDITGRLNAIDLADPPDDEAPELIKVEFPFSGAPAASDGVLYFGDDDGVAYAFDPDAGETLWTADTAGAIRTPATVVGSTVYLGNSAGEVVALATDDGSERWRVAGEPIVGASPTVVDGTVYVADFDGVVRALAADDGGTEWTATVDDNVREAVTVAGNTAFVADDSATVTALALDDGSERWRYDGGDESLSYGLAATEDVVLAHVGDERLVALDADTGDVRTEFVADWGLSDRPSVGEGVAYVGDADHVYALGGSR